MGNRDIFGLISEFMESNQKVDNDEVVGFNIIENPKIHKRFFRVETIDTIFIWYYEFSDDDIYFNRYTWLPKYQQYKSDNLSDAIYRMMDLGQTVEEISLHIGLNKTKVAQMRRDIIKGILIDKNSPYANERF